MIQDYVETLYRPAADRPGRWPRVRTTATGATARGVEAAGASAVARSPHRARGVVRAQRHAGVGATLGVRVFASLGELTPEDVQVQVVHGRAHGDDELSDVQTVELAHAEAYEGGRHRFEGEVSLARTGPIGYTVRVLPKHEALARPSELGLVAWPADVADRRRGVRIADR